MQQVPVPHPRNAGQGGYFKEIWKKKKAKQKKAEDKCILIVWGLISSFKTFLGPELVFSRSLSREQGKTG